jgi:putative phosphotransacetylase
MEPLSIVIEGSARHIHVSKEARETLFGAGYELRIKRELSQPGEFLSEEKLRVEGPRGAIDRISILGPERAATQVEISFTDARTLGLTPPVRESGDLAGSAGCTLVGPAGSLPLTEGVIAAKRHIHINPETAERYGLQNKDIVSVRVEGDRALTLHEVVVRVSPKFNNRMHLDFDEMNAAGLSGDTPGTVIKNEDGQ